ncbi:MAG: GNAT family N-acetyltransferase [Bacteroidia bacterium]|nr:GNAT family N-acetyltransferase [Bacteroidia bacterium]
MKQSDLQWYHALGTDEEIMKYIRPVNFDISKSQQEMDKILSFNKKHRFKGYWIACGKEDMNPLGILTLRFLQGSMATELGYRWSRQSWGRGYATEAANAMVEFGFSHQELPRMVAVVHPENLGSQKVLLKCGFNYKRKGFYYNHKVDFFEIQREAFLKGLKANPID